MKTFMNFKHICILLVLLASASMAFGQASVTYTNAGTTGTTLNSLAKINTSNNAVITATTDVAVPAYIVVAGNGTTGLGVLAVAGQANCTMDSTIASAAGGFYVINSATTGGDCHAQSAAPAYGTWVVGTLASASTTSGSVAAVTINSGFYTGTVPLTSVATQTANTVTANVTSGSASPTAAAIPSGIQNYVSGTGYNQASAHQVEAPLVCADSSASGTAQSCTTSPSFTPAANDCVIYTTTTTNSGAGLTTNIDSLGVKSVAIPGLSGWTTTLTAGIIPANKPLQACYDGTNWNVTQTGTSASGGGASAAYTILTKTANYTTVSGDFSSSSTAATEVVYTVSSATAVTHTLPSTVTASGTYQLVRNDCASGWGLYVLPANSLTLDGDTTQIFLPPCNTVSIISNGTNWISSLDTNHVAGKGAIVIPTIPSLGANPQASLPLTAINTPFAVQFVLTVPTKVGKITTSINTGVAACVFDMAIADVGGNIITHINGGAGAACTGAANTAQTPSTVLTLAPGTYYLAQCASTITTVLWNDLLLSQSVYDYIQPTNSGSIGTAANACTAGVFTNSALGAITNSAGPSAVPTAAIGP